MAVDEMLLERHRRFADERLGIREEFLQPTIGGGRTVAVLSLPLVRSASVGWVVCHSFGLEQIHLGRLDVLVARHLAAAGFPALRYHGQGYGESQGTPGDIGLSSHLRDAADAVAIMLQQGGLQRVGVFGAKLGGMVAAMTADRLDLDLMGLCEPVVRGAQFARDLLRTRLFSEMAGPSGRRGVSEMRHIQEELWSTGWVDIKGLRLTRDVWEEIARADLSTGLTRFRGAALLVAVSRAGKAPALAKLRDQLVGLGAQVTLEVLADPLAAQFGQFHFHTVEGGRGKRDVQLELFESVATTMSTWAGRVAADR